MEKLENSHSLSLRDRLCSYCAASSALPAKQTTGALLLAACLLYLVQALTNNNMTIIPGERIRCINEETKNCSCGISRTGRIKLSRHNVMTYLTVVSLLLAALHTVVGEDAQNGYFGVQQCKKSDKSDVTITSVYLTCDSPGAYYYGTSSYRKSFVCNEYDKANLGIDCKFLLPTRKTWTAKAWSLLCFPTERMFFVRLCTGYCRSVVLFFSFFILLFTSSLRIYLQ